MNRFNLDERDLLDGTQRLRQAQIPQISTTTTTTANLDPSLRAHVDAQYFGTRTLSTSPPALALQPAPNITTVNTSISFYPNIQSRPPVHGHQYSPEGLSLDIFPTSPYEAAEVAAKEERRRRNTAASARFRQKKKQKEEAMESRMANVQGRNAELEERVHQLEMENRWLKELITEKNKKPASNYEGDPHDEHEDDQEDGPRRLRTGRATNGRSVRSTTSLTSATDDGESSQ
ncbi:hypothetical protein G647_10189 [Cladophialophora carrionii CBS 160.54]|uniref:BZIP domain-containing protein n=1 Tax=Cladophialophora carrionii CBS 160.54 TaxID=1279043 RepID=V9DIL4_9EURO|nr:uncharacterized protein G647_10189 [Cladophialophora carrionii CBS 160.54]ETI26744.1 hypothetical protein G647_10189 [Cladophialophora carrionii CBS 160.54]